MTEQNTQQTETLRQTLSIDNGVTIRNDLQSDALILLNNAFHGPISVGYVRAGHDVTLPTIVNVDAYALFERDAGTFVHWIGPIPKVVYDKKKINLTPGQTYSLSNFS